MEDIQKYCQQIPKLELHSHLSGTIRDSTLTELLHAKAKADGLEPIVLPTSRYLKECFLVFDYIHSVVTDLTIVKRIMVEAIEDFAAENVKYLELRTAPKSFANTTKRQYLDVLIDAIKETPASKNGDIEVRLLPSVNRQYTLEEALDTVHLAGQYVQEARDSNSECYIVGVEISGNPTIGSFDTFIPALTLARDTYALPISIHYAEVKNYSEAMKMLQFKPERLGHGCFLNEELVALMLKERIPLEICLSSNVLCGNFTTYESHIFQDLYQHNYPMTLCTDDHGVFSTNLSHEYYMAAKAFSLSRAAIRAFTLETTNHIFASREAKEKLRSRFEVLLNALEI